jgi:hypothetical protein
VSVRVWLFTKIGEENGGIPIDGGFYMCCFVQLAGSADVAIGAYGILTWGWVRAGAMGWHEYACDNSVSGAVEYDAAVVVTYIVCEARQLADIL